MYDRNLSRAMHGSPYLYPMNEKVVMPRNAAEAKGLLLAAIREPDPVIFLEPKILYRTSVEDVPDGDYEISLGIADVMQEGSDVTVVRTCFGTFVYFFVSHIYCYGRWSCAQGISGSNVSAFKL